MDIEVKSWLHDILNAISETGPMISLQEFEKIHQILISEFGGANGIRDKDSLDSALARPFHAFELKQAANKIPYTVLDIQLLIINPNNEQKIKID